MRLLGEAYILIISSLKIEDLVLEYIHDGIVNYIWYINLERKISIQRI